MKASDTNSSYSWLKSCRLRAQRWAVFFLFATDPTYHLSVLARGGGQKTEMQIHLDIKEVF